MTAHTKAGTAPLPDEETPTSGSVPPEAGPSPAADADHEHDSSLVPAGVVAHPLGGHASSSNALEGEGDLASTPSTEQLLLPLGDQVRLAQGTAISPSQRVFCNRHMKMTGVSWIGFDMDYTLAIYDQEQMDELSIRATIDKLIARGYPTFIRDIPRCTDFPVRGLIIDKRNGNVLKMDRFKFVSRGYHGLTELSGDELRRLYHSSRVRVATAQYHFVDTLYALSEVAVYTGLVDAYEKHGLAADYGKLFADIRECIDEAHRDGTILDTMAADLPRYVHKDEKLAATLHKFRSAGKKLFLLTNSGAKYTESMMEYLLGGQMAEYPSWKNYFDIVVAASRKPLFFRDDAPFYEHTGDGRHKRASLPFERGKIYEGGNLAEFQRALGVSGDEVLYVGDHIFGDILRSKKESAWRTAMILQELETEIDAHAAAKQDVFLADRYAEARFVLEDELRFYQQRYKELSRELDGKSPVLDEARRGTLAAERDRVKGAVDRVRQRMRLVDREFERVERRVAQRFHHYWGSLLKEGNELSSFGQQVEDYACVYTSRVSNFLHYSPQQTFRSQRDTMPHEGA